MHTRGQCRRRRPTRGRTRVRISLPLGVAPRRNTTITGRPVPASETWIGRKPWLSSGLLNSESCCRPCASSQVYRLRRCPRGPVEIQGDRLGWLREAGAEQIDPGGPQARHRGPRGSVLQPAQGRLRTQRPADHPLEGRIVAQGVAVGGVLRAGGDGEPASQQPLLDGVPGPVRIAPVPQARRKPIGDPEPALDLAQQRHPAIRRQPAAIAGDDNSLARNGWQSEGQGALLDHDGCGCRESTRSESPGGGCVELTRGAFLDGPYVIRSPHAGRIPA